MTDPIPLAVVPFKAEVDADIVRVLEDYLDMARRGELAGVAIAGLCSDERTATTWSKATRHLALVGALERLKFRMLSSMPSPD